MYIYLDIETIPSDNPPPLDALQPPKNYKDAAKIEAWRETAQHNEHKKESFDSTKGQIICICAAAGSGAVQTFTTFAAFVAWMMEQKQQHLILHFVAHNAEFDRLFLFHAAIKAGNKDAARIFAGSSGDVWHCTMQLAAPFVWKYKISLKRLAAFLEIQHHKNDIDGGDVWPLWQAGKIDTIQQYCVQDVELLRAVHEKIVI